MKYRLLYLVILFSICSPATFSQNHYTQNIRGKVIDQDSRSSIPGVTVLVAGYNNKFVSVTDSEGIFRIENVPVGRITVQAMFITYNFVELRDIELKSGKELILTIEMVEKVENIEEVIVTANRKDKASNEMATVSARSFTVEETERYAGTWLDPARMAANYAGVMAVGDQRNDIIIRGNSPLGLLWKLEGVSIPNPNHFGTLGTTGGPISILNNNLLDNSDFFTGAFPAEYGNALSGVFDLKLRKGNNENYEFTAQAGMNGLEFGVEGPFSKKSKASFLINYRYSTLAIFDYLDIHFGVSGVPEFQDLSYKINFPTKKAGTFSFFGVGGISTIEVFYEDKKEDDWTFGNNNLNFKFASGMGVSGVSHFYAFDNTSYLKTVVAVSGTMSSARADSATTETETVYYGDNSNEVKYSLTSKYTKKFNAKNTMNIGFNIDVYDVQYEDSVLRPDETYYYLSEVSDEKMMLIGTYSQVKHKFTNDLALTAGVHFIDFTMNGSYSVEPRLGVKWNLNSKQSLSFGAGIHSQLQPRLFYYQRTVINDVDYYTNKNLDFSKSNQAILSYDYLINRNLRVKFEAYYQYLNQIPVEQNSSHFSMINYGTSFFEARTDSLINSGTGENYGIEFTLEKFLSDNYYFLFTSSIFESTYKGSDEVKRNTIYNGNYVFNFLSGYTFKIGNHASLNIDAKTVYAGGKHYIPVDLEKSELAGTKILDYSQAYEPKFDDYFRIDGRIGFKLNSKKFNTEFAFDLQNITNHKNILLQSYDVDTNSVVYDYQLGLFYVFFIRFQF
ncbi:MAG: TonB-dependent receptor [Bacteroidales bacterium]|nr:TonB-dependent receptor [Bacteroidales bacterium]